MLLAGDVSRDGTKGRDPFATGGASMRAERHVHRVAAAVLDGRGRAPTVGVGFYSENDEGVFTHMGSRTHIRCVVDEPLSSGHADRVALPAGTRIKFPDAH
ncbi:MAG: hypothetical protein HYY13_08730 [Nitrospirae bacterium]|nr:hypothetical protein [Nitrospirota bacterium]